MLGDSRRQRNLACCSPCDHRVGQNLATEQQQREIKIPMLEKKGLKSIILAFIITIKGTIGTNENQSKQKEGNNTDCSRNI